MLIDCGTYESTGDVVHFLKRQHIRHIDYFIGTHPHDDHTGGAERIINNFDIDGMIIYTPPELTGADVSYSDIISLAERKGIAVQEAFPGMIFDAGNAHAEIIAPFSPGSSVNNCSVCTLITYGDTSFLLMGDAEKEEEQSLYDAGILHHVSVCKPGHHGSKTSSSEKFLEAVSPDIVVISCGAGNSFAHPSDDALGRLLKFTENIYRTDLCGTITIESDGTSLKVLTGMLGGSK